MFTFVEMEPDDVLIELASTLGFLDVEVGQYEIDTEQRLDQYDFGDQDKYNLFFSQFAEYANPLWMSRGRGEWDFSQVPCREPSTALDGIYKILRTGGAYSEPYERSEAEEIEKDLRMKFQMDSERIVIICIAESYLSEDDLNDGFTVDMSSYESLGEISPFFNLVAWDDLIFIINPKYNTLYVIAFTDTD